MKLKTFIALLSCLILLTCLPGCSKPVGPSDEQVKNDLVEYVTGGTNASFHEPFLTIQDFKIVKKETLDETRENRVVSYNVAYDLDDAESILVEIAGLQLTGKPVPDADMARGIVARVVTGLDKDNDGVFHESAAILYKLNDNGRWIQHKRTTIEKPTSPKNPVIE